MKHPEKNFQGPELEPALLAAAADWIQRLQHPDVSITDFAEWLAWCDADERHKAAFDDMQTFSQQMDEVVAQKLAAASAAAAAPLNRVVLTAPVHRRRRWQWAAAASVAALALLLARPQTAPERVLVAGPVAAVAHTASPAAPSRAATLTDGSRVELAAQTSVEVEMTEAQRTVFMKGGVAFFTVAHNAARPFIVKVGKFDVRAVGTAFNVRSAGDRVVVTVAEGTVDVSPAGDGAKVRAKAGTEVVWTAKASAPVVAPIDPAHALAWREGRLDYINEPLEAVIADFNRYSRRQIVIRDAAVGEIAISGAIRTTGIEVWVRALPSLFPIEVGNDSDGNIVLSSRRDAAG